MCFDVYSLSPSTFSWTFLYFISDGGSERTSFPHKVVVEKFCFTFSNAHKHFYCWLSSRYPTRTLELTQLSYRVLLKFLSRRRTKGSSRQRKFLKARQCLPHALGACGGRVWEGGHPSHRGDPGGLPLEKFCNLELVKCILEDDCHDDRTFIYPPSHIYYIFEKNFRNAMHPTSKFNFFCNTSKIV